MLAQSLCELAAHVGLSQTAIARHLGVDRANVSYWARGHREVPEHHREALLALVFAKAKQQAALAKTGLPQARRRFFRKLFLLVLECRAENLQAHGLADTDSVATLVGQIEAFKTMPEAELYKPETAKNLLTLSQGLANLITINAQHGPLMALAEEFRHADTEAFESKTAQPAVPSTV
jgi:transcriptional regulator with XRE-family HTH domain